MKVRVAFFAILLVNLGWAVTPAFAGFSVLSGTLNGNEPVAYWLHDGYCRDPDTPFQIIDSFTVTESGNYSAVSTLAEIGTEVWFAIYEGIFNSADPAVGRIGQRDVWDFSQDQNVMHADLEAGTQYQLVVSPVWCSPPSGTWNLVFLGPGDVVSPASVADLDSFISGSSDDITNGSADIGCGNWAYHDSGPQRVDTSGTYFLVEASAYLSPDFCVSVYDAPFDPESPDSHLVAQLGDKYSTAFELNTGQDYYFIVTLTGDRIIVNNNDYLFLLIPGTVVQIDQTTSGSWYDPGTSGQGFFFDVLVDKQALFVGWMTYDLQRPAIGARTSLGDPGHRWMTAYGEYFENIAQLNLQTTAGGVFNLPTELTEVDEGTLEIELFDCNSGVIRFDLSGPGISGAIPIRRGNPANSQACRSLQHSGHPRKLNRSDP